jgi:hypothetical protein
MISVMAVKDVNEPLAALKNAQAALQEVSSSLERVNTSLAADREDRAASAVSELAEKFGVSDEALVAFVETAGELLGGKELSVADARRAGMIAAARAAWENELGPLLSTAQVRELLGGVSRQRVDELLRARRLIGLRESSGRWSYPLFQFDEDGPIELLVATFWIIADAAASDWTAASWCVTPDPTLDGKSARDWARTNGDSERLLRVARQDARRLSQ